MYYTLPIFKNFIKKLFKMVVWTLTDIFKYCPKRTSITYFIIYLFIYLFIYLLFMLWFLDDFLRVIPMPLLPLIHTIFTSIQTIIEENNEPVESFCEETVIDGVSTIRFIPEYSSVLECLQV